MLAWLSNSEPRFSVAFSYFLGSLEPGESGLIVRLLSTADNIEVQASLLRATNDPVSAWVKLTKLSAEVGQAYWQNFRYLGLNRVDCVHVG